MRWALILGNYEYSVEYVPACRNALADALSRLPIKEADIPTEERQRVFLRWCPEFGITRRDYVIGVNPRNSVTVIILYNYEYSVEYVPACRNALADALSRLPIKEADIPTEERQLSGQLLNLRINDLPLSKRQLQCCLVQDGVLAKVIRYLENGWPSRKKEISDNLRPFFERQSELSYEDHVLLWQG
ncbi:hypothetical protein M513_10241 [Trichuris suis]|uniref:Uncharacterized protein n=1 Tax=Trichuris suis TaxID=68888 RepID=A0A085LV82_9BILA|nr:hypothetical protein M513_10241 [Trichuris suis]